nr:hypothetical protein BaRGS_007978 [Batillaria attramentaria]
MWIKYRTDISISGRGFSASYTTSCNNRLTAFNGAIESPNFPQPYSINSNCSWTIEASPGNTINISFSTFDLETHSSCQYDYLELRDGGTPSSTLLGRYCGNTMPPALASTGNLVLVNFVTDSSVVGSGFHLDYATHGCGGPLTGASGTFSSPNYPNSYDHARMCEWTITVQTGKSINLVIEDFDMENAPNCSFDALEIYYGSDETGILASRLCHTQTTAQTLSSTGNTMYIRMRTDSSISGKGFRASYTAVDGGCGGNFSALSGVIVSKNYPSNYPHNTECEWLISLGTNQPVVLNFMDFDIEGGSCSFDYVNLYDGPDMTSPLIAHLCGRNLPNPVTYRASNNYMFIKMRADYSVTGRGFKANYTAVYGGNLVGDSGQVASPGYPQRYPANANYVWTITVSAVAGCGGNLVAATTVQDLQSPGYPNGYSSSLNCVWNIAAPPGHRVWVNITAIDLEAHSSCNYDYVSIYDSCGGRLRDLTGVITSPNYPSNYLDNSNCTWVVQATNGRTVSVTFNSTFNIPSSSGCGSDYVQLLNGGHADSPPLLPNGTTSGSGRYCGSQPPSPNRFETSGNLLYINFVSDGCRYDFIEFRDGSTDASPLIGARNCGTDHPSSALSTGNVMRARFRTDNSVTRAGFKANYRIATCGGRISAQNGTLTSPNYPANYGSNANCLWYINGPTGHYLTFTFNSFALESSANCANDYVEVREYNETGNSLGKWCGSATPQAFDTSDSYVVVRFVSNGNIVARGFSLSFQASVEECGGDLTTPTGTFTSPNYPGQYAHSRQCVWRITVQQGRRIRLTFPDFGLEYSRTCAWDYVMVTNGIMDDSPMIGRYCGNNTDVIESSANTMTVKFRSDGSISNRGFRAVYTSNDEARPDGTGPIIEKFCGNNTIPAPVHCGGTLTAPYGALSSPNYPNNYDHNDACA